MKRRIKMAKQHGADDKDKARNRRSEKLNRKKRDYKKKTKGY